MAMNIKNLTKHEMCMGLAGFYNAKPGTEEFNTEYESWFEDWLVNYMFVKMLGPNEALYLVAVRDDEGPNPYEGVCVNFAHLQLVKGEPPRFTWAQEWEPAQ